MTVDSGWVDAPPSFTYDPFDKNIAVGFFVVMMICIAVIAVGALRKDQGPYRAYGVLKATIATGAVSMIAVGVWAAVVSPPETTNVNLNASVNKAIADKFPAETLPHREKLVVTAGQATTVGVEYTIAERRCSGDVTYDGERVRTQLTCG